jgi:hypothetical protein
MPVASFAATSGRKRGSVMRSPIGGPAAELGAAFAGGALAATVAGMRLHVPTNASGGGGTGVAARLRDAAATPSSNAVAARRRDIMD